MVKPVKPGLWNGPGGIGLQGGNACFLPLGIDDFNPAAGRIQPVRAELFVNRLLRQLNPSGFVKICHRNAGFLKLIAPDVLNVVKRQCADAQAL